MFKTFISALVFVLLALLPVKAQNVPTTAADKSLPDKVGGFQRTGTIDLRKALAPAGLLQHDGIASTAGGLYVSKEGERFFVSLTNTVSDSAAYAELTQTRKQAENSATGQADNAEVGTAGFSFSNGSSNNFLAFFKGRSFVVVRDENKGRDSQSLLNFGKTLADTLDKGAGEIPVLVKHLPDWENVESRVLYVVNKDVLKNAISNQDILDVLNFDGGAEAVIANYGEQKLVVVEFNTASLATDNDQRIAAGLQQLRNQGQPSPTTYRRVGNYAVFVFDAPNEQAANQLIDQIKYQQVVTWLGENPFSYEQATREFTETTLGVFVSVVKASGIALVSCLAIGGFAGALLFSLRRSQQRAKEAYADSDAMLRLNLDDLTPENDPARLLGSGH
ncbi:MAG TPA: hypothetical protein VMZ30_02545 [Pyrinomonadaceae bacterium]|nr:hypothetical protein [Pyrinomonadaceae bacterium]